MKKTTRTAFVFMCLLIAIATGYSQQTIHKAAEQGVLADVKSCLQNGIAVDARDFITVDVTGAFRNGTPLMSAAGAGHLDVVKFLISKGADVNARSKSSGMTPLMYVVMMSEVIVFKKGAETNDLEVIKYLVANGADINAKSNAGHTPLMFAASKGKPDIVKLLVEKGADVNAKNEKGETALALAHKLDIVKVLVDKGADVNARDKDGWTPLGHAANYKVTEFLKQHGAKESKE